jgi:hypothetical protein
MELKHKHRQWIALGIGLLFILFGLLQALFGLKIEKRISDEVSFVLMIVAISFLLGGRKKNTKETQTKKLDNENDVEDIITPKE